MADCPSGNEASAREDTEHRQLDERFVHQVLSQMGALWAKSGLATLAPMKTPMSVKKQPRDKVSARIDPDVLEEVARVAEAERGPLSSVVRNVLRDWARAQSAREKRAA
jgi:hypothetical protein